MIRIILQLSLSYVYQVKRRSSDENSTQWTTGIAEIQLPIEYAPLILWLHNLYFNQLVNMGTIYFLYICSFLRRIKEGNINHPRASTIPPFIHAIMHAIYFSDNFDAIGANVIYQITYHVTYFNPIIPFLNRPLVINGTKHTST